MAFSKARRLGDLVSATGEVSAFADASIVPADLHATLDLTGKTITVATASANDNDTTVASTAFVQQELASLVDSAPGTLNTLNELAAALGDDANFSTTVTNSIATKLPLAGGTLTGDLILGDSVQIELGDATGGDLRIFHDGSHSVIANHNSSGRLDLRAATIGLKNTANNEYMLKAIENGSVELYYDNSLKLLTSSTGINLPLDGESIKFGANSEILLTHEHDLGLALQGALKLSNNETDDTNKEGHLLARQYDSGTETEGFQILQYFANSSGNRIDLGGASSQHNAATEINFYTAANTTTRTGTSRVTIDSSGNVGLGQVPNLHSGRTALQIHNSSFVGATDRLQLYDNIYYDGSDFKMIATGAGTLKNQYNGSHLWYNASSVSAGATANVFERMRLTPSGDLCIGGTNETHTNADIGTSIHLLSEVTGTDVSLHLHPDVGEYSLYAYNGYLAILDHTANAERIRLDSSGNVGINNNNPTAAKLVVKSAGGSTERTFQTTDSSDNETFWIQGGGSTGLHYWPFYVGKSSTATGNDYTRSGEYIQAQGPIAGGKNGRYIHDWWGPQITGNHSYLHLVTKMWGGGSPHGNTEYIMGGFMITGYRYNSGTKQHRAMHQFHNWSGSLYYHGVVDDGDWTGASHVYVNSDGFVTVRLQGGNYYMYTIDFVQYNQYDKHDVGISAATGSSNSTI